MKKIILFSLLLFSVNCFAQNYGNEIRGKANDMSIGIIKRVDDALKNSDSATHAKLAAIIATGIPVTSIPSVTIGTFPDNEPFNVAQINGVTPLMGAGNTGTGSLRVTIATDQVAIPVSQSGTWNITNISGTISLPTGASTLAEQQTQTTSLQLIDDVVYASDAAISKVAGIGGQFDDVSPGTTTENSVRSLRMSTRRELYTQLRDAAGNERGANVNASNELLVALSSVPSHAVTNAGTFAVQPASATAPVSTMNSSSANSGVNSALAGVFDDVSPTAITENNFGFLRMSANRNLYGTIRDAAGNERGANVTASNELLVSVNNASIAVTQATSSNLKAQVDPLTATSWGIYVEDAGETAGGNLMMAGGVRRDAIANSAGTTGDNATFNITAEGGLWSTLTPSAQGGLTTYHLVSAGSTNATSVKASAGQLYGYYIFNANASARKIAFHNTSGTPTAGSSVFFSIVIPASSGANVEFTNGIAFSSGIGITTVTGTADSDATGVASGDLIINLFYK